MAGQLETALRGPDAFVLARKALQSMETAGVWPTPLNFEIWLHYLGDPDSPLAREVKRILDDGVAFTDQVSEDLSARFLAQGRLSDEIRDAGLVLNRELNNVAEVLAEARLSQVEYSEVLAEAEAGMSDSLPSSDLRALVSGLTEATRKIHRENTSLEKRLQDSTQEVAHLREHLEQVRRDAMTDALTNLANRKAFDEELERACRQADADGGVLTLAVLDIDHFKRFNDTWGHQTGDQVLRYVASVLGRTIRSPRTVARYGGEEFAMLFPGDTASVAETVLNAVREEIASRNLRRRSTNDELGAVTVSIGLAQRAPGDTAQDLMGHADEALYASKHAGRNRVTKSDSLQSAA